jgi:hypothetical protein
MFAVVASSLIFSALRSSRYDLVGAFGAMAGMASLSSAPVHLAMLLTARFLPRKDGVPTFYLAEAHGSPLLNADSIGAVYYYGGLGLPVLAMAAFAVWRSKKVVVRAQAN